MSLLLAQQLPKKLGFLQRLVDHARAHPLPWAIGLGAVVLLVILVLVVRRLRRARPAAATQAVTPGALVKVWTRFLAQIPSEFRRYVLHFQSFVVLGEAGSGKSLLIGKCTDWKGQAAQFYPSYTTEPLLQLYLGSRTLVQEVPSSILADTSAQARAALMRLWRRTARKRQPIAVITISAATLRDASPDALRLQAQMLRGKLNVLSRVVDAPVQTRIVVTHMDQVEGYLAFADFVEKQEIPHRIALEPAAPGLGLSTCLEPFEEYLPLALTKLSARDHLRVLTFLSKGPATFERLELLLRALCESDPRSFEPDIRDLFLSSHTGGGPSAISNPFETSWTMHGQAIERAIAGRHRLITGVIALLGLTWLGAGFGNEWQRLREAEAALVRFEAEAEAHLGGETELALEQFVQGGTTGWARFLPSFSSGVAEDLRGRLAAAIRRKHLEPLEATLRSAERPQERALYLLGLVYADRDGTLGKFILDGRVEEFAAALGLPDALVGAYVRASDAPWHGTLSVRPLPYVRRSLPAAQPETWHSLFVELHNALSARAITADRLQRLQETARGLRDGLTQARRRRTVQAIHDELAADPRFQRDRFERFMADLELPSWLVAQGTQLDELLAMLLEARMDVEPSKGQNLDDLVSRLRGIQQLAERGSKTLQVRVEDKDYAFDERRWLLLIKNGKALTCVQDFVRENQRRGVNIFFRSPGAYQGVGMGANDLFFPGRGAVAGEYTRAAYVTEVVPQLVRYQETIERLDLEREARDPLENLVSAAIAEYAAEYDRQWRAYYDSWEIGAANLGSLSIILGKMKLAGSRFEEFLQTVAENTSLPEPTSFHQRRIVEAMAPFEPIARILAAADAAAAAAAGPAAERARSSRLDGYRSILSDALDRLDAGAVPGEKVGEKKEAEPDPELVDFEALLTPLGRLCFDIVREGRDSYLLLTREWLERAGIDERWRGPFYQPIKAIDRLGREDIEEAIAKSWSARVRPQLDPVMDKFPFSPRQPSAASPLALEEALLRTTGKFWVNFRRFIAPICERRPGLENRWRSIKALETDFDWPKDMLLVVNHVAELTDTLWDKDGVPTPIKLTIRAEPLPPPEPGQPAAVLAFLTSGERTVFGFNQRPSWQTLEVEWYTRVVAQVGLQLGTGESGERANFTVAVPEGHWALHRLLRTRPVDRDGVSFSISTGKPAIPTVLVRFSFQEDPFRLFDVPTFKREGARDDSE